MNKLNEVSAILSIIGFALSVVGIFISVYLYFKTSKQTKKDVKEIKENVDEKINLLLRSEFKKEINEFVSWFHVSMDSLKKYRDTNLTTVSVGKGLFHIHDIENIRIEYDIKIANLQSKANLLGESEKIILSFIDKTKALINDLISSSMHGSKELKMAELFKSPKLTKLEPHNILMGMEIWYSNILYWYESGQLTAFKSYIEENTKNDSITEIEIKNQKPTRFKNDFGITMIAGNVLNIWLLVNKEQREPWKVFSVINMEK